MFLCVFVRDYSQSTESRILTNFLRKIAFSMVAMIGFEAIPRFRENGLQSVQCCLRSAN